ncbi:hypothetical protein KCP69_13955 [Salmonella enterica subsp. enterica]|nr:hypothetical protein KCP69_13955 [Salmonella enterica subsp. enterica]
MGPQVSLSSPAASSTVSPFSADYPHAPPSLRSGSANPQRHPGDARSLPHTAIIRETGTPHIPLWHGTANRRCLSLLVALYA